MKRRKSIVGLVLSCSYLLVAIAFIYATACEPGEYFLCGKIIGALVAALPWTFPFFNNEGELSTMVAFSAAGITVNAAIIYVCGWAVEVAFRSRQFP